MLKFTPLLIALFGGALSPGAAQPQAVTAPNAVYVELGGNAGLYSLNVDRRMGSDWTGRIGLSVLRAQGTDEETGADVDVGFAIIPIMINRLVGEGAGRFELGIGPLIGIAGGDIQDVEGTDVDIDAIGLAGVTSTVGYRYQPLEGGFLFRASLTPFYSGEPQIWAGVSFGWAF